MESDGWNEQVAQDYDASSAHMYGLKSSARRSTSSPSGRGTGQPWNSRSGLVVSRSRCARGVPVAGIELSEPMVAGLRKKPGGLDIPCRSVT
jgi:hypothetical protein